MTPWLKTVSFLGLALTVLAPLSAWTGAVSSETKDLALVAGMVLWFSTAVFWIRRGGADG